MALTKAQQKLFVTVAAMVGSGEARPLTTVDFPPSEAVFYLASENDEVLLTENGDALVTEQSAT